METNHFEPQKQRLALLQQPASETGRSPSCQSKDYSLERLRWWQRLWPYQKGGALDGGDAMLTVRRKFVREDTENSRSTTIWEEVQLVLQLGPEWQARAHRLYVAVWLTIVLAAVAGALQAVTSLR